MKKLKAGEVIDGKYQILALIGRGGMAFVYKAERFSDKKIIAIKIPFTEFTEKLASCQKFKRAEKIGQMVDHPNIVKVFKHSSQTSMPYMLMEYVNGPELTKLIKNKGPLPLKQILKIAIQVCDALEYIHQHQIIHHDIKPDNIMLTRDDDVKILDFGLAYAEKLKEEVWADLISVGGTPVYMAPEQLQGVNDIRSDLYSLGIMMYEMATGKLPFRGDIQSLKHAHLTQTAVSPRVFNPQISIGLEDVIKKAMVKKPSERYQNAFEMRRDILNLAYAKEAEKKKKDYHYHRLILLLIVVIIFAVIILVQLARMVRQVY
ncbi:MAG: serine/threonine-protein kinase [bacterium]